MTNTRESNTAVQESVDKHYLTNDYIKVKIVQKEESKLKKIFGFFIDKFFVAITVSLITSSVTLIVGAYLLSKINLQQIENNSITTPTYNQNSVKWEFSLKPNAKTTFENPPVIISQAHIETNSKEKLLDLSGYSALRFNIQTSFYNDFTIDEFNVYIMNRKIRKELIQYTYKEPIITKSNQELTINFSPNLFKIVDWDKDYLKLSDKPIDFSSVYAIGFDIKAKKTAIIGYVEFHDMAFLIGKQPVNVLDWYNSNFELDNVFVHWKVETLLPSIN